jgi:thiol:disulfide interchange protein DsbD
VGGARPLFCGALAALLLTGGSAGAASPALSAPDKSAKPATKDKLARPQLIQFSVSVTPQEARRGETVKLTITGKPRPGYHSYPLTQRTADQAEVTLKYEETTGLKPLQPVTESAPEFVEEETGVYLEHKRPFTWSQDILILPDAKPGPALLRFRIKTQVCDAQHCVPYQQRLEQTIDVSTAPPVELSAQIRERLNAPEPAVKIVTPSGAGAGASSTGQSSGLLAFILAGVFWGAVSLVTPCVFPMIPITVSFFLKQSEKQHHRPVTMALAYCSTIVVVLTIAAVALLSFFRWLSINPVMNFGLGALFVFFALSLFGMYEIELPSGLARFTSAREGKGGLVGTMFMALTFTIISFACVAPFLGGFGGTAATADMGWSHRILGGLAFSATFASPFFLLALFPNLLKRLPKSGSWLNSVKVVMGFLELAAALKFLRAGELILLPQPALFTYDFVLGIYVALCLLCGLYLLNVYRLPHDTPAEHLSVPRMLVSALFLSLGLYLMPALFKYKSEGENQRPAGVVFAWLDSFLLPDDIKSDLPWTGDLKAGLREALAKHQLVLVDFTGETCTNCKLNERYIFPQQDVKSLMLQYVLVQLYTDKVPNKYYAPEELAQFGSGTARQRADAAANEELESREFNDTRLPLYVILKPKDNGTYEVVARYEEGKINNKNAFAQFLKKPLDSNAATSVARLGGS